MISYDLVDEELMVVVKVLIEQGASIDSDGGSPQTPLRLASGGGHAEVCEVIDYDPCTCTLKVDQIRRFWCV